MSDKLINGIALYAQPDGTPVHLRLKVAFNKLPKHIDPSISISDVIRQVEREENVIANKFDRVINFKPAVITNDETHFILALEGELGTLKIADDEAEYELVEF